MSWSLASTCVVGLLLSFTASATALSFPLKHYQVMVEVGTRAGDAVGQVVALSDNRDANITYSLANNSYADIDGETGELFWRDASRPSVNGTSNYTVKAMSGGIEESSAQVEFIVTSDLCSCAGMNLEDVTVSRAENLPRQRLLLIRNRGCSERSGYQLKGGDSKLLIDDNWLVVTELDYEESPTATGQLTCDETKQEVKVKVNVIDQAERSPYFLHKGKRLSFFQYDIVIDASHYSTPTAKIEERLNIVFDAAGSDGQWVVDSSNDTHNRLVVSPLQKQKAGRMAIGTFTVTIANTTRDAPEEIYIVVTDHNIDTRRAGTSLNNSVVFLFNITYTAENLLDDLPLQDKYDIDVIKNAPINTKILQVLNESSKFLTFTLDTRSDLQGCGSVVSVTPHQGVLYVNDTEHLSQCDRKSLIYSMRVSQASVGSREALVYLNIQPADELVANTSKTVSCADYKYEGDCNRSSGVGSLRCQWKVVLLPDSSNYSTCASSDTCADGECSEYESVDMAICPQDCLDGHAWYNTAESKYCRMGSLGICHAGICFCTDNAKYCQCTSQELLDMGVSWTTVGSSPDSSGAPSTKTTKTCGVECVVGIAIALAISIIVVVFIILWCKLKNTKRLAANINDWRVTGNNLNLNFTSCPDYEGSTPSTVISAFSEWPQAHPYLNTGTMEIYDEKWELSRDNLLIGDFIGEGEFGKVLKAQYRKCLLSDWSPVAVKMLKDGASRVEFGDLLSEYTLLKEVDHPNVIKLIGAATLNGPFHLVVEYCEHGSLKNYLRRIRTEEPAYINGATKFYAEHANQLMDFSSQISKGMQYLSEIKLVHRDLATRNILIDTDNVIKISDFGMTKDIYEEDAYKKKGQGRIPVKWMAPESLYHQIYTTKSDVWSFGIVLWEITTLGATPYPGIPAERMYNLLQEGYRMDRPETCSTTLYTLMRKCWDYDPATRPSFKEIRYSLEKMLESGEVNLDLRVAAQDQRVWHGSTSTSTGSDDDSELRPLTVALLPNTESKFVADFLVSTADQLICNEKSPLRYTTLEFADDE